MRVRDLISVLDNLADPRLAEEWDNVGLIAGAPEMEISAIMVALDPTLDVLEEALSRGCNALVTHHPLIFAALKFVRTDYPEGRMLARALTSHMAILASHTNLDKVSGGVSDTLALQLGLCNIRVLAPEPNSCVEGENGFGRIGEFPAPLTYEDFVVLLKRKLALPYVKMAGVPPVEISKVAVCGGSGSELALQAMAAGAQVYLTGEIKHSVARWAESERFCLVDGGHYATENLMVKELAAMINRSITASGHAVSVVTSERQSCPFKYY